PAPDVKANRGVQTQARGVERKRDLKPFFIAGRQALLQLGVGGEVCGIMQRLATLLEPELADDLRGVPVHDVERRSKPPVDAVVEQAVSEKEQEANGKKRQREESHHHARLESRSQLLLAPLHIKLQQNAGEDERKDYKSHENKGGKRQQ